MAFVKQIYYRLTLRFRPARLNTRGLLKIKLAQIDCFSDKISSTIKLMRTYIMRGELNPSGLSPYGLSPNELSSTYAIRTDGLIKISNISEGNHDFLVSITIIFIFSPLALKARTKTIWTNTIRTTNIRSSLTNNSSLAYYPGVANSSRKKDWEF